MRDRFFAPLLVLLPALAAPLRADAIHYEQIPADVTSYLHLDVDRLVHSQLAKVMCAPIDPVAQEQAWLGGRIESVTGYSAGKSQLVLMVRMDEKLRAQAKAKAAGGK